MITNNINPANRTQTRQARFGSFEYPKALEDELCKSIKKCKGKKIFGRTFGADPGQEALLQEVQTSINTHRNEQAGDTFHKFVVAEIRTSTYGTLAQVKIGQLLKKKLSAGLFAKQINVSTITMRPGKVHEYLGNVINEGKEEQSKMQNMEVKSNIKNLFEI